MRKTWQRLLVEVRDISAAEPDILLGEMAERTGQNVERIMDAIETIKILEVFQVDVRDAYEATVIGEL